MIKKTKAGDAHNRQVEVLSKDTFLSGGDKLIGFTAACEGAVVHVRVSPYSWMYGSGTGISLALKPEAENAERTFVDRKDLVFASLSNDEVVELALEWLRMHGVAPIQKAQDQWAKVHAEYQIRAKAAQAKAAKKDAADQDKWLEQGFTHRVRAAIHPKRGGDDYIETEIHKGQPDRADIERRLKRKSAVVDYLVQPLCNPVQRKWLEDLRNEIQALVDTGITTKEAADKCRVYINMNMEEVLAYDNLDVSEAVDLIRDLAR